MYQVGLGKDGLFICLYEDEKLVAIAQKDLTVVNFKDKYTLYIADENYYKIMVLAVLYYDALRYDNLMEVKLYNKSTEFVYTKNKELISKFDAEFIQKVIES